VTDLRAWAKKWNDASLRQVASLREPSSSSRWPLIGMFAIGLVAGAVATYAVTQQTQIKLLARRALTARRELLGQSGEAEVANAGSFTSPVSNHRRKAVVEVS
jgi:hypothetical protein